MKTILTNSTVIDCTGNSPMENATIFIEDNKIARLQQETFQEQAGEDEAPLLDLEGKYVLPGLWSNHAHLSDLVPDPKNVLEKRACRLRSHTVFAERHGRP